MKVAILAAASLLAAAPAFAQTQDDPQAAGLPLSEILAKIEAQADFASIHSVEWDDEQWEVEYRTTDGSRVEVEIDPATGEPSND